jgi:hypothetical protein
MKERLSWISSWRSGIIGLLKAEEKLERFEARERFDVFEDGEDNMKSCEKKRNSNRNNYVSKRNQNSR